MAAWIWILIPLAAILMGGFQQWLKFKQETARIDSSTEDLQSALGDVTARLETVERERSELVRRVQNLEAIVTSEAWDALSDDPELARAKAPTLLDSMDEEEDADADRAARLARRLRTR